MGKGAPWGMVLVANPVALTNCCIISLLHQSFQNNSHPEFRETFGVCFFPRERYHYPTFTSDAPFFPVIFRTKPRKLLSSNSELEGDAVRAKEVPSKDRQTTPENSIEPRKKPWLVV